MFGKKSLKCDNCNSKIDSKFSFCPYCSAPLFDEEKHMKDYGFLGLDEDMHPEAISSNGFGITDKILGSLINNLVKTLDKQFKQTDTSSKETKIKSFPNGIRIQIGQQIPKTNQKRNPFKHDISEKQIKKMSALPRAEAKSTVKRIGDKIVYELNTPGITSPEDIFISKLESGYEVKAIGDKTVYVNNLPVNLPLRKLSMSNEKLFIEFLTHGQ